MRILGIDTGKNNIGLAIYNTTLANITNYEEHEAKTLAIYYPIFKARLSVWSPDVVVFEKPFFTARTLGKNIKTLETIGIQKLACEELGILYSSSEPSHVKKCFTGDGRADKQYVIELVNTKFSLNLVSSHVADACAIAYSYWLDMESGYKL